LYAGLARTNLRRRPGERVKYSNLGAGLLSDALARAADRSYEELVRERICLPLGMRDTVVTLTSEQTARLATGHTRRGKPAPPLEIPALVGAGALRSTATDLLRFLRAKLKPADTPLTAQIERTQLPRLRVAKRTEVGLGWMIARLPGLAGPVLWHNGGTPGFRSFVGVGRETGTAVVVLSNTARSVDRLGLRLLNVCPRTPARCGGLSLWESGLVGVGAWLAVALPPDIEVDANDDANCRPDQPQGVMTPQQEGAEEQEGDEHGGADACSQGRPIDAPNASDHRLAPSGHGIPGSYGMPHPGGNYGTGGRGPRLGSRM
jgi:CubicO group peptidase (beta-lactamase class C family)